MSVSARKAAQLLRMHRASVVYLCRAGKLVATKGRDSQEWRIDEASIEAFRNRITPARFAGLTGYHVETIRLFLRLGVIPGEKSGRTWLITSPREAQNILKTRRRPPHKSV